MGLSPSTAVQAPFGDLAAMPSLGFRRIIAPTEKSRKFVTV